MASQLYFDPENLHTFGEVTPNPVHIRSHLKPEVTVNPKSPSTQSHRQPKESTPALSAAILHEF